MKKFLSLLVIVLGMSLSSNAQINTSSWMIGGTADIQLDPTDLVLNPILGYFVMDNLAVGGNITISKADGQDLVFGIGPFARYYLNNGFFGQVNFEFTKAGDFDNTRYGISLGYSYELTDNVRIEPTLPLDFSDGFSIGFGVAVQAYFMQ